ncbi:histidine phosphotransferase family protein [Tropicibacter naphthalenivorans]|uniref:Histidine phosphotransferase ChpT C-terminal domain-containing protein n=1 Tax=Tropicibacter naphthalenivorans TaxID=441103 RepID=A0A0P1GPZ8_9RHOB|nr:histidine phosphotransferase family protein [Tropicibacter naphthalenivorans]CUH77677.1 hypothetical protein TRN7648_01607 [Tropicibacter naphthalenivorans]SMC54325.1 histidine phosphotransferase ChpT [Tropicibacter naphthalenivorans]
MPQSSANLASLVGSRLCHDLISPIGAIQNGLELIALSGGSEPESPEMSLIQESCTSATARIQFFRVAFGSAKSEQTLGQREIVSTLTATTQGGRLRADWVPQGEFSRHDVQLAFLTFLCCESALPAGGTVRIDHDMAGWSITATGPRLNMVQPLWDHLNGLVPLDDVGPERVHFALLVVLAEERGYKVMVTSDDSTITIKIA